MIIDSLFEKVLVEPATKGADGLYVASGYARPAMAAYHLEKICESGLKPPRLTLLVGMCAQEGMYVGHHKAFRELSAAYPANFKCFYLVEPPPVHSKVYVWTKSEKPVTAFTGSANYSQTAFGHARREAMVSCDAKKAFDYISELINEAVECTHSSADKKIEMHNEISYGRFDGTKTNLKIIATKEPAASLFPATPSVQISFLDRSGQLPAISGLNWGQRLSREPNQAYIKLPAEIYRSDFFPERKAKFTVITDDGKAFTCARAQDNGKAIHTPQNNSLFGVYFRERIGVAHGKIVTKRDLERYGRTHVDFYRLDEETFYMDFSPR